jgi:regulator of replication initiation timing
MITLEQIQVLEQKIDGALHKIASLAEENRSLKAMGDEFEEENRRLQEENRTLTDHLGRCQREQQQIEEAVAHVISRLEAVETTILETVVQRAESSGGGHLPPAAEAPRAPPVPPEGSPFAAEAPRAPPVPQEESPFAAEAPGAGAALGASPLRFGQTPPPSPPPDDAFDFTLEEEAPQEEESAQGLFGGTSDTNAEAVDSRQLDIF